MEALEWGHRHGSNLDDWQRMYDDGRQPPAPFFERPEISRLHLAYWDAFTVLSTERPLGMVLGPIPASKIVSYIRDEMDAHDDRAEYAFDVLYGLDRKYLEMLGRRAATRGGKPVANRAKATDPAAMRGLMSRFREKQQKPNRPVVRKPRS
jgi:hypothetical protein